METYICMHILQADRFSNAEGEAAAGILLVPLPARQILVLRQVQSGAVYGPDSVKCEAGALKRRLTVHRSPVVPILLVFYEWRGPYSPDLSLSQGCKPADIDDP
jgi:hypothetical protein